MNKCPTREQLQEFLVSEDAGAQDCGVVEHVSQCSTCQNCLEALAGGEDVQAWQGIWEGASAREDPEALEIVRKLAPVVTAVLGAGEETGGVGARPSITTADAEQIARLLEQSGRFSNVRRIGSGGFGIVFRASGLHPDDAVKVLRPDRAAFPDARSWFEREARHAASIRHDNVVTIHEVSTVSGPPELPIIIMEFVPGESLRDRIRREGHLPARDTAEIIRQTALGLQAAHEQGMVHRDVKPSNILLEDPSGRVKVSDFGLAVRADSITAQREPAERIAGTLPYMSPEHLRSGNEMSARSDVFSLGVVLYELLAGERPFRGTGSAVRRQILDDEPRPPRELDPGVDPDLEAICLKCLQKNPAHRYGSAGEVAEDLQRFLRDEPVRAKPDSAVYRTVKYYRRNRMRLLIAAALTMALFVALVGGLIAWTRWQVAREMERGSLISSAVAGTYQGLPGRRFEGLEMLASAASIRSSPEIRDAAVACMMLTDVRLETALRSGIEFGFAIDKDFERYAASDRNGEVVVRRVSDHAHPPTNIARCR